MFTSMNGKSVVITGASKGIGFGIAEVFAAAGANVIITSRHQSDLDETVEHFKDKPGTVKAIAADVTDPEACRTMAEAAVREHGGIDILCANAGIFPSVTLEEMAPEQLDEVLGVNLKGAFYSVQACLAYLERSGRGRIILTSSITGILTGYPGWTHYGASKAGQIGFLRTAAMELAVKNITVNAVLPGNVMTEGLEGMGQDYLDEMVATVPLKRLGTVREIGHAALFFASEEAGYITGQTLVVDGGQVLPESLVALQEM